VKLSWHFSKVNPRFKNREATQGEFFASDTQLRAFIREAVQNSLDARRPGSKGPVSVRIFVSGPVGALPSEVSKRYLKGGWDHFHAEGSGLRDAPGRDEPCPFLTYEDSGTTGLTGDVEQYHEVSGVRNPFYYFFRAEGQSNKLETGRGRWGLGKFVFPRSSRIRSFFGLTVRFDDNQRLLVGQAILRSHNLDGKSYTPDGWFGVKPEKDEAALPVDDPDFITQFAADFGLERGDEPGLSLVVPFCDEEWTAAAILESVIQDYFYVILHDELVVTIEDPESLTVLNSQSLPGIVEQSAEAIRQAVLPLLSLTLWALDQQKSHEVRLLEMTTRGLPKWNRKSIAAACLKELQQAFNDGSRIALRIPVEIQRRQGATRSTWFDVWLERCEGSHQKRPLFVRDGIIISDVRSRMIRDLHAIVTVEDPPLTEFLGDAENPAHTEWHEESSHFRGKYVNGAATLRFIRNAVSDLCQLLQEAVDTGDAELLLDVFSVGSSADRPSWPVSFPATSSRDQSDDVRERLSALKSRPRKPPAFRLSRRDGGFRIAGRSRSWSHTIEVAVAYDRRGGSPLRHYVPADFQLGKSPIHIEVVGAAIEIPEPNRIIVLPGAAEFEVTVDGFDLNRDLFLQTIRGRSLARQAMIREELTFE